MMMNPIYKKQSGNESDRSLEQKTNLKETSAKGTIAPERLPLAYLLYYVITVSPASASIFITTLYQLGAASRIELQHHWLQQAAAV